MAPVFGRLLLSLLVLAAGLVIARTVADATRDATQDRDPHRYRPKGRGFGRAARDRGPTQGARSIVRRHSLSQLRDALSGAPLSADDELFRCATCQSFYTAASVRALAQENAARCLHCGGHERLHVEVVD